MKRIRIGGGAGYSGDRIEPAAELAEKADIQYLIFECLAERTIALAQQVKRSDPARGYDPLLAERMRAVLGACARRGITIVTNMGAANPLAGARAIGEIASSLNLRGLRIAAIVGDDVVDVIQRREHLSRAESAIDAIGERIISANAYLGAEPIAQALAEGADVVITGRVADPSLVVGPLVHEFGLAFDDWSKLGKATLAGHLLECAGQVTGGYFADPGYKDVPDLARLGFPIGEVAEDGDVVITKLPGSGGRVTAATCKEQILYEVHDPSAYVTPDVVADFSDVTVTELAADRVAIQGGGGRARTETLKVSVGYVDSYLGEGQISYAGPGAITRARLALDIVRERLNMAGVRMTEARYELIGVDAIHGPTLSAARDEPYEVRVRVAGRTDSLEEAVRIGNEVETLYTCGPAAGGGVTKTAKEIVAVASLLVPRDLVRPDVQFIDT
jgi:acyclic terpene utilization AtuA family protein